MGLPQANPLGLNPQATLAAAASPAATLFTPAGAAEVVTPPELTRFPSLVARLPPVNTGRPPVGPADQVRRPAGRPSCPLVAFGVGGKLLAYFPSTSALSPTAGKIEAGKLCLTDLAGLCG